MQSERIKSLLRDAVMRYTALPFERLSSLKDEPLLEEVGLPDEKAESDYCQIEVCLVDRFVENGIDVLHVSIIASGGYREFGVDLFFYQNGRVRWDEKLYEFFDGIPQPVDG